MPVEEDIKKFCQWANKLGCPMDAIPSDDALKSLFKSRQRAIFCNMMNRVRPKQEVQAIRENILIRKMDKLKDNPLPTANREFLPEELQNYLKIKDLRKKKEESEKQLETYRQECQSLSESLKAKDIQCIRLMQKQETIQARVYILEFKLESLCKDIAAEEARTERILANTPTRLSPENASETAATEAVKAALQELEAFYNLHTNNFSANPQILQDAKNELWQKMRNILRKVPNFLLFNTIMRMKEQQLHDIKEMNKDKLQTTHSGSLGAGEVEQQTTTFEVKMMRLKADILGLIARHIAATHEHVELEEHFCSIYPAFVDDLKKKVNLYSAEDEENVEEAISEFIVQYNMRSFKQGQIKFLQQQIGMIKAEIESDAKLLENHEMMIASVKKLYSEINSSINRVQYDMQQLAQIKEKILYSKNMMKLMLEDVQSHSTLTTFAKPTYVDVPKLKVNDVSVASIEGFDPAGDTVFCSTKLDMDATTSNLNNTTLRRNFNNSDNIVEARHTLPPHTMELNMFAELPLEKLSCIPKECAFYFSPNPLIFESRELSPMLQVAPGILLTPCGALQEIRQQIMWAELIRAQSYDVKLNLDLVMVDPVALKRKFQKQREHIAELLDNIDIGCINTKRRLEKLGVFYEFMKKNPLRHFIPATKTFNNLTYADFEAEFKMYYRMYTIGTAPK